MALTVTPVRHPNTNAWEGEFLGVRARAVVLSFDDSYDSGGETLSASMLGWNQVHAVIPLGVLTDDGSDAYVISASPNSARTAAAVRVYEGVDAAPLAEVAGSTDLSDYSVTVVVLGS